MKRIILSSLVSITLLVSCKKYLDIPAPDNQLVKATVFQNSKTATAALLAIYAQLESENYLFNLAWYAGLSSDELVNYSIATINSDMASNHLLPDNGLVLNLWAKTYKYLYAVNSVLEGIKISSALPDDVKKQLSGEAYFLRAFFHFYLVNFFGKVPLAISTDYAINSQSERASVDDIYNQIVNDLNTAKSLLTANYVTAANTSGVDRVRANKYAAIALLARVYLYRQKWADAVTTSSDVINQSATYTLVPVLNNAFLKNTSEAVWQVLPVLPTFNTVTGASFILFGTPSSISLAPQALNVFSTIDKRRAAWIGSIISAGQTYYFPYKYKVPSNSSPISEYTVVLRLAEQYLIRAEAKTQAGDIDGGISDLNQVRARAGLSAVSGLNSGDLLDSILVERQRELFTEPCHRWFDLARTGKINSTLSTLKPGWVASHQLYPIPQSEINRNPRLTQNPGY